MPFFVFEAAAITLLFVQGSIFRPLRERGPALWRELAGCPLCLGFWVGLFGAVLHLGPPQDLHSLWKTWALGALSGVIALGCKYTLGLLDEACFVLDQLGQSLRRDRFHWKQLRKQQRRIALVQKRRRMRRIERSLARQQEKVGTE